MSDGKDELRKRFEEEMNAESGGAGDSGDSGDTGSTDNSDNTSNTKSTSSVSSTKNTGGSESTGDTGSTQTSPGPERSPESTRNRERVLLYLPEMLADDLGDLYDEFDARERLAGGSGVEKHADFMTELIQMALDHEDELAERLDIPSIDVED